MKVVVNLTEKEVEKIEQAIGIDGEDETEVADGIHILIELC